MRSLPVAALIAGLVLVLGIAAPAAAAPLVEEVVSFSTHDGLTLAGILSLPAGEGPFPGVLLIAGSGVQDADVTIDEPHLDVTHGPQRHFRALARHLSRRGWAVLRYNKRGASFGHQSDEPEILNRASLGDLVEDARNAFRTLRQDPRVAARPLVVYGHSEGSMVAARLVASEPTVDLVVLAGSVAGRFAELLRYQLVERNLDFFTRAADADGDGRLTLAELDALDGDHGLGSLYVANTAGVLYDAVTLPDGTLEVRGVQPQTDADGDGRLAIVGEIAPRLRGEAEALIALGRSGAAGRYLQSLLAARPLRSTIADLEQPVLLVHGEVDAQTPVAEALALAGRLAAAGRPHELLLFPGVGHTLSPPNDFVRGDGGATTLDNPTLDVMKPRLRRRILRRLEANLP